MHAEISSIHVFLQGRFTCVAVVNLSIPKFHMGRAKAIVTFHHINRQAYSVLEKISKCNSTKLSMRRRRISTISLGISKLQTLILFCVSVRSVSLIAGSSLFMCPSTLPMYSCKKLSIGSILFSDYIHRVGISGQSP